MAFCALSDHTPRPDRVKVKGWIEFNFKSVLHFSQVLLYILKKCLQFHSGPFALKGINEVVLKESQFYC